MGRRECGSGSPLPSVAISVHNTDGGRKWFLRQKGRIKGCFSLRGKIGGGKAFSRPEFQMEKNRCQLPICG